jgi:hypothetical protein
MVRFQYWMTRLLLRSSWLRLRIPEFASVLSDERLRARCDVCREWLRQRGHRALGGSRLLKIAFRQLQLAVKWMAARRFPLDDY